MDEQDTDKVVIDGTADLLLVMEEAQAALTALWQGVEPLLRRSATRNLMSSFNWNYWRVCDALRHSYERMRAAPHVTSDGTLVWEDISAAVTNEPEMYDGQDERLEMAASGRRSGPRTSRLGGAQAAGQDWEADANGTSLVASPAASGAPTYGRRETDDEGKKRAARREEARLAKLRKVSSSKRRYPKRRAK